MADEAGQLQILVDIRTRLDELTRGQTEMRGLVDQTKKAGEEANKLTSAFKTGLGIEVVRRGIDLLTSSFRQSVGEAFRMAGAIKDQSENLGITTEAYQVLGLVLKDAGGSMELLTQMIAINNRSLAEARGLTGAASNAYRTLGLDPAQLEGMAMEDRLETIGRAMLEAKDQTQAYGAASQIVGSRNLPMLMGALKTLATDGYGNLANAAKRAGIVMESETIQRLDRAQKQIEKLQRSLAIAVGDAIGDVLAQDPTFFQDTAGVMTGGFNFVRGEMRGLGAGLGNFTNILSGRPWVDLDSVSKQEREAARIAERAQRIREDNERQARADAAAAEAKRLGRLETAQHEVDGVMSGRQGVEANPLLTDEQRNRARLQYLDLEISQRKILKALIEATPVEGETSTQRLARIQEQMEGIVAAQREQMFLTRGGPSQLANAEYEARTRESGAGNPGFIPMGQGAEVGALDWANSLGSRGEQVAATMQSTLGATVQSISEGIFGWITGAENFGDVLRNLGGSVLNMMLNTIVQMGVQWLITAALGKSSLMTTFLVASGLRKAETAEVLAQESVKAGPIMANAAGSSISSFGLAAALGIAALVAVMAAFGGFASGGYTGAGGVNDPAGVVHRGEDVWSQADIARWGGVANVEAMRVGGPAAMPVAAGTLAIGGALAASAAGGSQKRERIVAVVDKPTLRQILRDDPDAENVIADVMYRRRADLAG